MKIFYFWHNVDKIPAYIQACIRTWYKNIHHHDIVLLTYDNMSDWSTLPQDKEMWEKLTRSKIFSLAKISDVIRCDVLLNNGGAWLDCDTIIPSSEFEEKFLDAEMDDGVGLEMFGSSNGYLKSKPNTQFLRFYKEQQVKKVWVTEKREDTSSLAFGYNMYVSYIKKHPEQFKRHPGTICYAEGSGSKLQRHEKYVDLYFNRNLTLNEMPKLPIYMLHNSWTPKEYKSIRSVNKLFCTTNCTMTNILRELS